MLCENCGENEANVNYTEIINGVKKQMHLCDKCYKKLGLKSLDFNMPIDFSSFFGEFLNEYDQDEVFPMLTKPKEIKCDKCNMTYEEFVNTGKFGCDHCYEVFEEKIEPLLKRIHGSTKYLGRSSKENELNLDKNIKNGKISSTNKIEELKKKLKEYVQEENYEEAAKVRDEIKNIERKKD